MLIESDATVLSFFDPKTFTGTHLVASELTNECVIIDSVMGFDDTTGGFDSSAADVLIKSVEELGFECSWLLETHTHADHISAGPYLRSRLGGRIGVGAHVSAVREGFERHSCASGANELRSPLFDHLLSDGERFSFGQSYFEVLSVPGHTPDACAYRFGELLFIGDTLFYPDLGSARCDFTGGDPSALFRSIKRILGYPISTRLFLCHDYPVGRPVSLITTVGEQRVRNIHVRDGIEESEFVCLRRSRDADLSPPRLMNIAVGINVYGGSDGFVGEERPSISSSIPNS
jgi:glyoxylase-like metal-dependent hydrolase (beta-lactamase superfamily II)